jgi:hypothetical protein
MPLTSIHDSVVAESADNQIEPLGIVRNRLRFQQAFLDTDANTVSVDGFGKFHVMGFSYAHKTQQL